MTAKRKVIKITLDMAVSTIADPLSEEEQRFVDFRGRIESFHCHDLIAAPA
jgi:hypothetical protein